MLWQLKYLYKVFFSSDDELYTSFPLLALSLKWSAAVSCNLALPKWAYSHLIEPSLPVVNDLRLVTPEKLMRQICAPLPPLLLFASFSLHFRFSSTCFFFSLFFTIQVFILKNVCGGKKRCDAVISYICLQWCSTFVAFWFCSSQTVVQRIFFVAISLVSWWWVMQEYIIHSSIGFVCLKNGYG